MKTVIYLDVLLAVNFVAAAFLLAAGGVLCGAESPVWRLVAGAGAAALASLVLLAPKLPLPVQVLYQVFCALAIVRLAYRWQGWRQLLRLCGWYFVLNMLLAGAVMLAACRGSTLVQTNNLACYLDICVPLLFGCVAGVYVLLRVLVLCFGPPEPPPVSRLPLTLCGAVLTVSARYDTAFFLADPMAGCPVLLVRYAGAAAALPQPLQGYLAAYFAGGAALPVPPAGLQLRFLECETVAGRALVPAVPGVLCADMRVTVAFSKNMPQEALYGPALADRLQGRSQLHAHKNHADHCRAV